METNSTVSPRKTRMIGESFQISEVKLQRLRELAAQTGRSKSSLLREAVDMLLGKYEQK